MLHEFFLGESVVVEMGILPEFPNATMLSSLQSPGTSRWCRLTREKGFRFSPFVKVGTPFFRV